MANQYKYSGEEQTQEIKKFIDSTIKPYVLEQIIHPTEARNNSSIINSMSPSLYTGNFIVHAANLMAKLVGSYYSDATNPVTNDQLNNISFNHTALPPRDIRVSFSEEELKNFYINKTVDPINTQSITLANNNCLKVGMVHGKISVFEYALYGKCFDEPCNNQQDFSHIDNTALPLTRGWEKQHLMCLHQTNEDNTARVEYKFVNRDNIYTKVFKVKCDILSSERQDSVNQTGLGHKLKKDQDTSLECRWQLPPDDVTPAGVIDSRNREYRSTTDSSDQNTKISTINIDDNSGNTWGGIIWWCLGGSASLLTLVVGYINRDHCKKIFNRQVDLSAPGFGVILDVQEIVIDPASLPLSGENYELHGEC